jgi:hypothetical protein
MGLAILLYTVTVIGLGHHVGNEYTAARLRELELLDQINSVYLAAISGSIALGGTLILQLWRRGDEYNSPIVYRKTPPDGASNV